MIIKSKVRLLLLSCITDAGKGITDFTVYKAAPASETNRKRGRGCACRVEKLRTGQTLMLCSESSIPKALNSQTITAITTTTLRILLIFRSIGIKEFTSQRITPTATRMIRTLSNGIRIRMKVDFNQIKQIRLIARFFRGHPPLGEELGPVFGDHWYWLRGQPPCVFPA